MEQLYTTKQTAKILGMSESWLRQSRMKGIGPKFIKVGHSIRYRPKNLDIWLNSLVKSNTVEYRLENI